VQSQQVVIVGAGIVGLSTAYALLRQGVKHVTVLDQAVVDHVRGTSRGLSRLLRFEYGSDIFYSRMVQLSLERWRKMEQVACRMLYTRTGLLALGYEHDNVTRPSYHVMRELGLSINRLSRAECAQRYPQFATDTYDTFTYSVDAGLLHASVCLHTLKELILDLGGVIIENHRISRIKHDKALRIVLHSGEELLADRVVVAAGPWIHYLLGDLHLPVRLTRQYVLYFANLSLNKYKVQTFPAFMADDLYGFPIYSTCTGSGPGWFKGASHSFGVPVDPEGIPPIDELVIAQVARRLCDLLPDLRRAKLAHVDSCMYDVSPDEDFILDHVPGDERIVFATGLTGHGFKFGPVLGELLSSLVLGEQPPVPMQRFRLARFAHTDQMQAVSVA
jgi:monomeric sarcosine oxidase